MSVYSLLDQAAPLMKRYYDDRMVLNMAYSDRPLFAWLPKKTGVVGGDPAANPSGGWIVPVTIDDIAGESANFASAKTAMDGDTAVAWTLNRVKRYGMASLDWETVRAMGSDVGAFMRTVRPRMDSAINQLSNSVAFQIYGDGTGHRGQVASVTAGVNGSINLTAGTAYMARFWGLKRTVEAANAATGGTVRVGSAKVTGVDIAGGKIFVDNTANITGLVANDYIFPLGDHTPTGTTQRNLDGLGAWGPTPASITLGNPFKGVDRAQYKEKLLMLHASVATSTIDADIRAAAAVAGANGARLDSLFLHNSTWSTLETKLASQSRYEMMLGSDASTGFDTIVINAGGRKINVYADPNCPPSKGYFLQRDTWAFFSIDRFPDFLSRDGNNIHQLENEDSVAFRMGGYFNLACRAPGYNMVLNIT